MRFNDLYNEETDEFVLIVTLPGNANQVLLF